MKGAVEAMCLQSGARVVVASMGVLGLAALVAAVMVVAVDVPRAAMAQAPAAPAPAPAAGTLTGAVGETQTGLAAYYSQRLHGHRTASGERFNNRAMTMSHQTLPYGTKVRVTNTKTGKSVVLRVNDRGPTQPDRIVDVSRAAAQQLGFVRGGLTEVKLEVVEAATPRRQS
ncbi:MAG: septal ring lytic transglycosylase RlpA family protein [Candidatus Rokubacteria bacterium]|nr:septal ring lytic transglycosylase RlpA family protein [Candidatus Rokubacteria bacterium]